MTAAVASEAAVHSYNLVYWIEAAIFAFGAIFAGLLFRRRSQGLNLSHTPAATPDAASESEPVLAH